VIRESNPADGNPPAFSAPDDKKTPPAGDACRGRLARERFFARRGLVISA
jgi:hypothetical protein